LQWHDDSLVELSNHYVYCLYIFYIHLSRRHWPAVRLTCCYIGKIVDSQNHKYKPKYITMLYTVLLGWPRRNASPTPDYYGYYYNMPRIFDLSIWACISYIILFQDGAWCSLLQVCIDGSSCNNVAGVVPFVLRRAVHRRICPLYITRKHIEHNGNLFTNHDHIIHISVEERLSTCTENDQKRHRVCVPMTSPSGCWFWPGPRYRMQLYGVTSCIWRRSRRVNKQVTDWLSGFSVLQHVQAE